MTKTKSELQQALDACHRELQTKEARFRNIITRNADGILVVDTEGRVRFANPAAAAITGRSTAELEGELFGFPLVDAETTEVDIVRPGEAQATAEMRVSETRWEGERCHLVSLRDITERKQAEKRIVHLNNVLRAVRNVSQLIVRETDRDRLLQSVCDTLVETRGYYEAWIVLLDADGNLVTASEAGLGEETFQPLLTHLEQDGPVECIQQALEQPGVQVIKDPVSTCGACPLVETYGERGALSVRLEHSGEVYGVLTVSTPQTFIEDDEEHALFAELAGDLALALHNMALERRREELEQIINRSPAVAFLWRAQEGWPVDYVSENVKQFGYAPEDFYAGRINFVEIVHPDDRERVGEEVARATASQAKQFTQEYRIISASGDVHWVDDRTWIRRDARDEVTHYEGIILDITEQRQFENALQRSEEKYRSYIDNAPDGIFVADETGRYVEVNRAACEITGYSEEELLAKTVLDLAPPEAREGARQHFAQVQRTGQASGEFRFRRRDGRLRWWSVEAIRLSDQRYLGFVKDVTARREAQKARERLQHFLASTLDALSAQIAVIEGDGTIVTVNAAWRRLADERGMTWSDYGVGRNYLTVVERAIEDEAPKAQEVFQALRDLIAGKREYFQIEYPCELPRDQCWFLMRGTRFESEGGPRVVLAHEEITERKQAEEKVKRYAAELERSNRELEQFAYIVSHDLREPARMVQSYLDLLERRYRGQLDEKADKFIDYAVGGAERMQEMIRALLDLSRVKTRGKPFTPTDLEATLERTLKVLGRAVAETDAEVTHDPLPTVMGDQAQLGQIFQNLIANAIKFRREGVPPRVHIGAERQGDAWVISVADNGIGIDPQQADRIFQVFQRLHTEDEYPGLGVGLALCKRIVERHGGRIWVESEPGAGSTFYFTLPTDAGGPQ